MQWLYNGKIVSDKSPSDKSYGFVYLLTLTDGRKYIGKKVFWSQRKVKLCKRELAALTDRRAKKWKLVTKESDWRRYTGSSKVFGSKDVVSKEILHIAKSKRHLTYLETKELFIRNVLEDEQYLNDNISGKFYKGNLI